jgi:hypothetical protein
MAEQQVLVWACQHCGCVLSALDSHCWRCLLVEDEPRPRASGLLNSAEDQARVHPAA